MYRFRLLILLFFSLPAAAQHYYQDVISAEHLGQMMKTYKEQNVKAVSATGFDARSVKNTEFNEWQAIDTTDNHLYIVTRNGYNVNRQHYYFSDDNQLIRQVDSSQGIITTLQFKYDAKGSLQSIQAETKDSLGEFSQTEIHQWLYNTNGHPEKMWKIVNGNDSSEYRFKTDEFGDVTDEILYRYGQPTDPIYYYYNDAGDLTDIVRYNKQVKKLMPDFMFENDEQGRVIQKMIPLSITRSQYMIWRYIFNDKGLKTREALFDKDKQMTGKIEYAYSFYK